MAYNVSNDFRPTLYSGDCDLDCILSINGNIIPNEQIARIDISDPIVDSTKEVFYIGTFISKQIKITFRNLEGLDIASNQEVDLEIGLRVNGDYEYVPIGVFLIDNLDENYYQRFQLTCLDKGAKFLPNIDYSPCFVDGKATIDTIFEYICQSVNVPFETYPHTNGDIEIGTFDSTVSAKQWISYIAEIKGCNARITRDGTIALVPVKNPSNVSINASQGAELTVGEKLDIKKVVYFDAIRNFTYGDETGNTLFIRQDNPFIENAQTIENIYDVVKDTVIYNLKCRNYYDFSLDASDIVTYTTVDGQSYTTYYNVEALYEMSIMGNVNVQLPTKQQEVLTNVIGGDLETKSKVVKTKIDNITGDITLLTRQTVEINNNLTNNYYTKETVNQLVQNAETGVTNTFSEAGGNNIFHNSGLWFLNEDRQTSATSPYEFWVGNVVRGNNEKASNRHSLILQQGTLYQEQVVPNGNYTISFKYKKLLPLSEVKCIINNVEYELTSTNDTEFNQTMVVNTQDFKATFTSTMDNACEIYDLMVNAGTVKLAYSQNQNETVTDTVNISKGITITSNSENTTFKANTDGVRIFNNSNMLVPKTKFTEDGTETDQLIVNEQSQIVGILRQKVGSQIWDCMI